MILGHQDVIERFRRSLARGKLASTFLFVGPAGIGKRTFAMKLAQVLLCETKDPALFEPCEKCSACLQVAARTHPDLHLVSKPDDKSVIPLELLIGDDEHRMREGLCFDMSLKPFCGGRRIAILDDADYLNQEGANCLLKTLEEPPASSVIILITTSEQKQLPTIRSRCQVVRFKPLPLETVEQLLLSSGIANSQDEAKELASMSDGSLEQASELADQSVREFRQRWFEFLAAADADPFEFAKELSGFVDAAGKDAPPRRTRIKQVARWAADFFYHLLRRQSGSPVNEDPLLAKLLDVAETKMASGDTVSACLDRCFDVHSQVDANANQATLLECWLDDLAQIRLHGGAVVQ